MLGGQPEPGHPSLLCQKRNAAAEWLHLFCYGVLTRRDARSSVIDATVRLMGEEMAKVKQKQ